MTERPPPASVRLDVWLDVACLFRTRSEAQRACRSGKVAVNGVAAKPHRELRAGDELRISRPMGRHQTILVKALADVHVARPEARLLYEDRTPAPTEAEIEARRLDRLMRAAHRPPDHRPDRRDRRSLRRLKEGGA